MSGNRALGLIYCTLPSGSTLPESCRRSHRMRGMIRETYLCDGLAARVASAPECLDLSHRVRARASCSFFVEKTGENRGALWRRSVSSLSKRADDLKHQPRRLSL